MGKLDGKVASHVFHEPHSCYDEAWIVRESIERTFKNVD